MAHEHLWAHEHLFGDLPLYMDTLYFGHDHLMIRSEVHPARETI